MLDMILQLKKCKTQVAVEINDVLQSIPYIPFFGMCIQIFIYICVYI